MGLDWISGFCVCDVYELMVLLHKPRDIQMKDFETCENEVAIKFLPM